MLSERRNTHAAHRLLRKALKAMSDYPPSSIAPDKFASYPKAIRSLQSEELLSKGVEHHTSKYFIIEADHGALKRVTRPTRGLQRMENGACNPQRIRGDADSPLRALRDERCGHDRRSPSRQPNLRPNRLKTDLG
jgi:hypothetical protein